MLRIPTRSRSPRLLPAACCLLVLSGCGAGWQRVEPASPAILPERQQVQVWTGRESRVLHGVVTDSVLLTGVPFHRPPGCDSCRVAIPRADIDSVRFGSRPKGFLKSAGLFYVAAVPAVYAIMILGRLTGH